MNRWENVPFSDLVRNFFARKPKDVDGIANTSALYYREWMLKKIFGRFEWGGIPDTWDLDYLQTALFLDGIVCITDTSMGVLPLQCGVTGINVFNRPTTVYIANPVLGSLTRTIDEECSLVKLQYNYRGCGYMLDRYSALLAMCDSAISVNLLNSKVTFVGLASSKAQAESMKQMYDRISMGEPAVFVNGDVINAEKFFFNNVKQNFIADDVQLLKRKIINEFLSEIGINNANLDKRERLNSEEVRANNEEIYGNVEHWLENITEGLETANRLYGLNLSIKLQDFGKGGAIDELEEYSRLLPGQ